MISILHTIKYNIYYALFLLAAGASLSSCEPWYLAEARQSLAYSINTFGEYRYCDFSIDIDGVNYKGDSMISTLRKSDSEISFTISSSRIRDMVPCFPAERFWMLITENVNLQGDFSRITFDDNVPTVFCFDTLSEAGLKTSAHIYGWLYNKALTKEREQAEYDIDGEIFITWEDGENSYTMKIDTIRFSY